MKKHIVKGIFLMLSVCFLTVSILKDDWGLAVWAGIVAVLGWFAAMVRE